MREDSNSDKTLRMKYIIVSVLVIILLLAGFTFYFDKSEKSETIKLSDNMIKEKSYDSLKIVDIKAYKENKWSHLTFTVKNITDKDYKYKPTNIVFFDNNGKEVYRTAIAIPEIASGGVGHVELILDKKAFKSENFRISD